MYIMIDYEQELKSINLILLGIDIGKDTIKYLEKSKQQEKVVEMNQLVKNQQNLLNQTLKFVLVGIDNLKSVISTNKQILNVLLENKQFEEAEIMKSLIIGMEHNLVNHLQITNQEASRIERLKD